MTTTAERFKALRQAAGLSQVELAERLGIIQAHVSAIETGRIDPGAEIMARYCVAMGWRLADLIGEERAKLIQSAIGPAK
ncbi:HTH_XRE domain containing protein [uncultured Caudovirales phage]|uniref:HTH_XRE domain containing protein n=1 Tax=uncultured Caudovirales phage TaxID=2100421 RepID=A0A6J5LHM7_9CAUD|nr:HTH_XRE domain containing protein [uncultured Caudovirales phage]